MARYRNLLTVLQCARTTPSMESLHAPTSICFRMFCGQHGASLSRTASEYKIRATRKRQSNAPSVTSDCDAVGNIYSPHNFTDSAAAAAAVALNAGTDLNCGSTYLQLKVSVADKYTTEAQMDVSMTRLYNALFTVGFFDGQPEYDGECPNF